MNVFGIKQLRSMFDGYYWAQFKPGMQWVPCYAKTELAGHEELVTILFIEDIHRINYWPEDPEMHEPFMDEMRFIVMTQPVIE